MFTLATQVRARRLTAEFLQSLRARGTVLGVDDYQRVQELLLRLPADTKDATLGNTLVAIFATTPDEQRSLQGVFATSIALTNQILAPAAAPIKASEIAPPTPDEVKQDARDRRKLLWAGLPLLLVVLAAVAYYLQPRTTSFAPQTLTLTVGQERALPNLDTVRATIGAIQSFDYQEFPEPSQGSISLRADALYYRAGQEARPDSARLLIHGTWNRRAEITVRFRIDTLVAPTPPPIEEPELEKAKIDFSPLPLPYPRSLADLAPKPDTTTVLDRFLYQWWWPLVGLFFGGCLSFLFFLLRFLHRRKQRLVARRDRLAGAPHFWRIRVPNVTTGVDFGETYPLLLRQLRQRREADHQELDVAGTIDATIHRGGMPTFAYKGTTRPAEYLLLIDRGGADNHRAQLFELLYQRLRGEEVLIERYFYDGDPRLLYQDDRTNGTTLPRLRDRLPNAQLVLVGTGDQLLNAANGKTAAWATRQLATWGRPSLLTPRPHNDWGRRERRLDELLNILPATIQGLGLLTSRLSSIDASNEGLTDYRPLLEDLVQETVHFSGNLISSLQKAYDETKLKWIAACALYPSTHWELTLYLGAKTGELNSKELLTSRNVLELCRLPWFVRGTIPEPARIVLTEWLRDTHPEDERKLRAALLLAINQAEPPENSVANQELTLQRLQNEWMLAAPNSPQRARAADQIAEAIEAGGVPDATVVKYLSEPLGRFDIPLDDKWKKRLYPGGLPGLGYKSILRQFWLLLPLLLSVVIMGWWWQPELSTPQPCDSSFYRVLEPTLLEKGDSLRIQLCSRKDSLVLAEYFWQLTINEKQTIEALYGIESVSALIYDEDIATGDYYNGNSYSSAKPFTVTPINIKQVIEELPIDSFNREHQENIGAMLWNHGLKLEGDTLMVNQIACDFYQVADSLFRKTGYRLSAERKELLARCRLPDETVVGNDTLPVREEETVTTPTAPGTGAARTTTPDETVPVEIPDEQPSSTPRPQMQAIPAGTFQMGDTFGDKVDRDELPVHAVTLSAFELARFELTFEEYDLYCDSTGVEKPDDEGWGRGRRPVININCFDAVKYCNWLSEQHGYTAVYRITGEEVTANWFANGYRLPTEAEWEYAARSGGKQHRFGNGKDTLRSTEANFNASPEYVKAYSKPGEYREKTTTVGSFGRNGSGLADMSGNVWEWCWDRYGADYYEKSSSSNPKGPGEGAYRVLRGGSCFNYPANCRAAFRISNGPADRGYDVGFRLARSSRQGE